MIAAVALCSILGALSFVHVYWAFGGRRGALAAVPQNGGEPLFEPGPIACLGVALALGAAAILPLVHLAGRAPNLSRYGLYTLAAVFAARAVGDFRYVGFFKKKKEGRFARLDTLAFAPLCVALAMLALAVASS